MPRYRVTFRAPLEHESWNFAPEEATILTANSAEEAQQYIENTWLKNNPRARVEKVEMV